MAKKVYMVAPWEALTGNISGNQVLKYAENNNPAYEAPNGTQYARNYRSRYVVSRRGKDGLVYFQVKQTTATVLTPSTRRTMAILGVTAAIRSSLQASGQLNNLKAEFEILKQAGTLPEGQETFNKWFSANIKNMLVYKRAEWRFTLPGVGIVSIHNPYHLSSAEALSIKQSTWVKFANMFAFSNSATETGLVNFYFSIDGMQIFVRGAGDGISFDGLPLNSANSNYAANFSGLTMNGETAVLYHDLPVYTPAGAAVLPADGVIADTKYTTADPNI